MQQMGYNVDVLVSAANLCQTTDRLMEVAHGLRVDLRREGLQLLNVEVSGLAGHPALLMKSLIWLPSSLCSCMAPNWS